MRRSPGGGYKLTRFSPASSGHQVNDLDNGLPERQRLADLVQAVMELAGAWRGGAADDFADRVQLADSSSWMIAAETAARVGGACSGLFWNSR